jgi:dephospho-CoA kinase
MPRIIGLTGSIACGKTTVGHILLELGVERYIDADAIVHHLYESGQPIALQVIDLFGSRVLGEDGGVDRTVLGSIVFRDPQAMRRLEAIVHPAVSLVLSQELASISPHGVAIIDAVKLLEGASGKLCQSKWLVIAPQEQQMARLMARNHLTEREARLRLVAQPSWVDKLPLIDELIDNGGTLEETRAKVVAAYERFGQKFPAEALPSSQD